MWLAAKPGVMGRRASNAHRASMRDGERGQIEIAGGRRFGQRNSRRTGISRVKATNALNVGRWNFGGRWQWHGRSTGCYEGTGRHFINAALLMHTMFPDLFYLHPCIADVKYREPSNYLERIPKHLLWNGLLKMLNVAREPCGS